MPIASRANGDRMCRTGVFGGGAGFRLAGARFLDAERLDDARDDERREGEVFVAMGR